MSARDELSRICGPVAPPELTAALDAYRAEVLREAAEKQRKFVLSDEFVCDDWEAALEVADLIDPDETDTAASSAPAAGDKQPEPQTRQCGHDDYHTGHAWADQPHIWCPGHTLEGGAR